MIYILIFATLFSILLIYLMCSDRVSKDEKEMFFLGSLASPLTIPLITLIGWFLYFYHG